jgi:hypothetical protein
LSEDNVENEVAASGLSFGGFGLVQGTANPTSTIFGSIQALSSGWTMSSEGMDWPMDTAWDDMSQFGWPTPGGHQSVQWNQAVPTAQVDLAATMAM